jgi:PTS system galactitol-specific IIB component
MAKTKIVLVACGTAVATSTVVAKAIEEACKKEGIPVMTRQCKAAELMSLVQQGADLIVTTTPVPKNLEIPVIQGLPFLTGIGKEQTLRQIVDQLKS